MSRTIFSGAVPRISPYSGELSWRRSRYGFVVFCFLSLLGAWTVLRVILFATAAPAGLPVTQVALAFLDGFYRDAFVALVEMLPLLGWIWIVPDRSFQSGWHRIL